MMKNMSRVLVAEEYNGGRTHAPGLVIPFFPSAALTTLTSYSGGWSVQLPCILIHSMQYSINIKRKA